MSQRSSQRAHVSRITSPVQIARTVVWISISLALGALAGCGYGSESGEIAEEGAGQSLSASATAGPLVMTVPAPPRPVVTTDEQQHWLYEIVFQNVGTTSARVTRLDVVLSERPGAVARFENEKLAAVFEPRLDGMPAGTVPPGGLAAVFLDLPSPSRGEPPPCRFTHRVTVEHDGRRDVVAGPTVAALAEAASRIGPPLRGGSYLDLNGCCDGPHRRALLDIDGQLMLAQRYAIDFIRVDLERAAAGEDPIVSGDPTRNESYFTFGQEIVAVTAGRIIATRDGVPENDLSQPLPPATIESAPGNFVIQALDDGRFALYAHIQNGKVRVHPGERVRRGQVLGLVGNTGNSTGPHLHFHVMDRPSALGANGLPYVFDRFDLQGHVDLTAADAPLIATPPPQERRRLLPMSGDLLAFP